MNSANFPKKVKIIATIGPASESREKIMDLVKAGVDIFRINLSHAVREEILDRINKIRQAEKLSGRPIAVMGDLVGPKIRIGTVAPGVNLVAGQKLNLNHKQTYGSSEAISINFPTILKNLEKGNEIYLGDGEIKLEVLKHIPDGVQTKIIVGGELRDRMGFSSHGISMRFPLTEKDEEDIKLMCELGADALAISFVQSKENIEEVRKLLPSKNPPMLVAKIETLVAVEKAEEILDVSDGLMVARGDLGFSVPIAELPHIQKNLIDLSRAKSKPVITATQMLESMIKSHFPTRAEVTDVANAILDGTDAVMLSAETAIGEFPVETVKTMRDIIKAAEKREITINFSDNELVADAISSSTVNISEKVAAPLIIVFTESGYTARVIARHRPKQLIFALTSNPQTIHRLSFSGGVFPFLTKSLANFDEVLTLSKKIIKNNEVLRFKKGDYFVISAGAPFGRSGTTNLLWVNKV
ncbi:MAG TPA: pyruvate kinase [Candidatus Saccharimonadales bacterium]|nr:pyruvate kinase [Candidatus Saccharimonadales bacterium]